MTTTESPVPCKEYVAFRFVFFGGADCHYVLFIAHTPDNDNAIRTLHQSLDGCDGVTTFPEMRFSEQQVDTYLSMRELFSPLGPFDLFHAVKLPGRVSISRQRNVEENETAELETAKPETYEHWWLSTFGSIQCPDWRFVTSDPFTEI